MRNRKPSGVKRACRNFNGLLPPNFSPASITAKGRNKEQPLVQARNAVWERGGRAAARAGDFGRPDRRQGPQGHAQANYRPKATILVAQRWRSGWQGRARAVATERGRQLRRPTSADVIRP
jgi:hypothetical protein